MAEQALCVVLWCHLPKLDISISTRDFGRMVAGLDAFPVVVLYFCLRNIKYHKYIRKIGIAFIYHSFSTSRYFSLSLYSSSSFHILFPSFLSSSFICSFFISFSSFRIFFILFFSYSYSYYSSLPFFSHLCFYVFLFFHIFSFFLSSPPPPSSQTSQLLPILNQKILFGINLGFISPASAKRGGA